MSSRIMSCHFVDYLALHWQLMDTFASGKVHKFSTWLHQTLHLFKHSFVNACWPEFGCSTLKCDCFISRPLSPYRLMDLQCFKSKLYLFRFEISAENAEMKERKAKFYIRSLILSNLYQYIYYTTDECARFDKAKAHFRRALRPYFFSLCFLARSDSSLFCSHSLNLPYVCCGRILKMILLRRFLLLLLQRFFVVRIAVYIAFDISRVCVFMDLCVLPLPSANIKSYHIDSNLICFCCFFPLSVFHSVDSFLLVFSFILSASFTHFIRI